MTDYKLIRREQTRESIKLAALEIAREKGWPGVTIRKIADRIHYTAPIVYEYFKNKDDLYHQLVQDGFREMNALTTSAVESVDTTEQKLLKLSEARYDFAVNKPLLHQVMFDVENPEWHKLELAKSITCIKDIAQELILDISGDKDRVDEYSFNLICLIKGYTYFVHHFSKKNNSIKDALPKTGVKRKELFLNAVKRFIQSIKQ